MIFEDFGGKKNWTAIKTMFEFCEISNPCFNYDFKTQLGLGK